MGNREILKKKSIFRHLHKKGFNEIQDSSDLVIDILHQFRRGESYEFNPSVVDADEGDFVYMLAKQIESLVGFLPDIAILDDDQIMIEYPHGF